MAGRQTGEWERRQGWLVQWEVGGVLWEEYFWEWRSKY